jgi:hypothetical protein
MITGLFRDRANAERAYRAATELGYKESDINVVLSEAARQRQFGTETRTPLSSKAKESTEEALRAADELGGPAGGTINTITPAIAALGTLLLIPGLGLVAAGPIAIALTAAGAVGVATGLIGVLTDWGFPKARLKDYEAAIRDGGILIGVKTRSDGDAVRLAQEWRTCGGELVQA